jgi:hypothetical protein
VPAVPGAVPSAAGGAEPRNVAAELKTGAAVANVQLGHLPGGRRAHRLVHPERPRRSPRLRVSRMPSSAIRR